jgi:glucosyl-3-phosphoglycerate synthase
VRSFHHAEFSDPPRDVASVSICLPARNEAETIAPILTELMPLVERGLVEQVLVVDDSIDGTGEIAAKFGAEVFNQSSLLPELGPVQGKGDAMWRALSVLRGDVVCYLDADSRDLGAHFALGLVGPLLVHPELQFVKAFYRRPWQRAGVTEPDGGGRVTELTARPLLNRFYPELASFRQPLAGELAARRDLLMRLPFCGGYAVEVAMLIDAWRIAGIDAMAQVDLDVRQNRHKPLDELGGMAAQVLAGVTSRLEAEGRLSDPGADAFSSPTGATLDSAFVERPPMTDYAARARRSRFTVASA